ncbi:MAG TPA: sporulation integral membrane protein YtvI [Bacillota bacterium]|nr:sporulation integral membrane protein YtvI [Bacillota bacterium]
MYKHLLIKVFRCSILVGVIVGLYFLISSVILYVYPFICAVIISMCINPIVTFLQLKVKIPRFLATLMTLVIIFFFIIGIIFLIITEIIQGTTYLAEQIPNYFAGFVTSFNTIVLEKLSILVDKFASFFQTLNPIQQQRMIDELEQFTASLTASGASLLKSFFLNIPEFLTVIPHSITILIFMTVATFLITNDWYALKKIVNQYLPKSIREYSMSLSVHFKKAIVGYVKGQLILICISATIIFIGLVILQVKHALTIVFFAAIVDALPLLGTGLIFVPWIGYLFLTGNFPMTLYLSFLYMIVIVVRQVIEPKILASSIGINPLLGLFVMYISIQLWGVIGLFIAPVILIIVYVFNRAGIFHRLWNFINA